MYLDPGFGSMVIQALIGLIAVGGSYLFIIRQKVRAFFTRKRSIAPENAVYGEDDGEAQENPHD